jgi:ferritin
MIGKKMEAALNKQINNEIYSAYLYAAMSAQAANDGFKGVANWFMVQAKEEMTHAMKFFDYLIDQQARPALLEIKQPPAQFKSPLDMFEKTLEHEKTVTKAINDLVDLAARENDHATAIMLQWFVTEQIEEEANASEIIGNLKLIGDSKGGLFMMDHQLGKREFAGGAE